MQVFRPTFAYVRIFLAYAPIAILAGFFFAYNRFVGVLAVCGLGLMTIAPYFLAKTRLELSDAGMLTSYIWGRRKTVNLALLTDCKYHLCTDADYGGFFGRGGVSLTMVFHLYDANGGYVALPIYWWPGKVRRELYARIASAVTARHIQVTDKTAKRLGLNLPKEIIVSRDV